MNKKALGPVVATALLLVVAVVAVVGFQSWFGAYSSTIQTDVETKSSTSSSTRIEKLVGNDLYVRNGYDNLSVTAIKIEGIDCSVSQNISGKGVSAIPLNNCAANHSDPLLDITIITDKGIFSKTEYVETIAIFDLTPDAFSFTNTSASPNLQVPRLAVVTGFDGPLAVTISGHSSAELRINSEITWDTQRDINSGDTLHIRMNASGVLLESRIATVTLGTYSVQWNLTTDNP